MRVNDWLSSGVKEVIEVVEYNNIFTKGVKETFSKNSVSLTLTDQGDYYEAYVVVTPTENGDIEEARREVRKVESVIGKEDPPTRIATDRDDNWAESTFKVDVEMIKSLS